MQNPGLIYQSYSSFTLSQTFTWYIQNLNSDLIFANIITDTSPGAKMGTWKCLRVQGFMIDPESIGVLKEIKLGCHDGNLGELFLFA